MYIKIRKLGEKSDDLLVSISKKAKIQALRNIIFEKLNVDTEQQKLFYKGKQLIDDHCLVDYDVQLNDVIQLMISTEVEKDSGTTTEKVGNSINVNEEIDVESSLYKVGDLVDMRDIHGAWYEGKITRITQRNNGSSEEDFIFYAVRRSELERAAVDLNFKDIRPQSYYELKPNELSKDQAVLVNYNIDEPKNLGYWYDFKISEVKNNHLVGTVLCGADRTPINCEIRLAHTVYRIESQTTRKANADLERIPLRKIPYNCSRCKDDHSRKCRECGCQVCTGKQNWDQILLCDECDFGYHIFCLNPPLEAIPDDDEWYCPKCKTDENEIVKAGDKLKFNKKKANMPSAKTEENARDWGKGMACVGRTKECTLVSKHHIGPIPGVEVGTCWKFRFQVSEAGVHRPLVAGIHGRESSYAYSIVLSGGYEDDIDNGDEFIYTGSGGRDLSGNKRVSEQSCDQVLTRMNKALAMNCNAKFNPKDGAEAEDWRGKNTVA